jgi:hypothetical protein
MGEQNWSNCFACSKQMSHIIKDIFFYKNVLDVFRRSASIGGHLRQLMAFLGNPEMRPTTKACFGLLALQVSIHGLKKLGVFE